MSEDYQTELTRRHKATVRTVRAMIVLTLLLSVIAFLGRASFRHRDNPQLNIVLRIAILSFGLGSVVLRRTRFSAMRLQDITALDGVPGLLGTLERTTLQVALMGGAMAVVGLIVTLMTGNDFYTYGACLVAFAVLLYCYPSRTAWQRAVRQFSEPAEGNEP